MGVHTASYQDPAATVRTVHTMCTPTVQITLRQAGSVIRIL